MGEFPSGRPLALNALRAFALVGWAHSTRDLIWQLPIGVKPSFMSCPERPSRNICRGFLVNCSPIGTLGRRFRRVRCYKTRIRRRTMLRINDEAPNFTAET